MLTLPACQNVFVCGPVSSGKTHLIKTWLREDNRHVVFDSTGEFIDDEENAGREQVWANPKALNERIKANPYYYRIVYQPGPRRIDDFGHVVNVLWWSGIPRTLVCDEFHEICPVEGTNEIVERLLRFARHVRLGLVGASQRIADVHKLYTSGCRMVILFWTQEARDLDAIEDRWRCANTVSKLRPLLHNDATGQTMQIPQCVVCLKGQAPFIYDFASESVAASLPDDGSSNESGESQPADNVGSSDISPEETHNE